MEKKGYGAHVLALSYPSQGHANPLASKGVRATFAITHFIFKTMQPKSSVSVQFDTKYQMARMRVAFTNRRVSIPISLVWKPLAQDLSKLIKKYKDLGHPIDCIVYDSSLSWALDVARIWLIFSSIFHSNMCCNFHIYRVYHGLLKLIHIYKIKRNNQAKNLTESENFFKTVINENIIWMGSWEYLTNSN